MDSSKHGVCAADVFASGCDRPGFCFGLAGLANTYVDLYRWGRNSRDLKKGQRTSAHALKLDPNLAEAHVAIGQALAIQRQFKDAAAEFERAIELDPILYDAYYFYARSSFEAGDLEKAVQLLEKAHRSRPEDYQAMALRALALHELGARVRTCGRDTRSRPAGRGPN